MKIIKHWPMSPRGQSKKAFRYKLDVQGAHFPEVHAWAEKIYTGPRRWGYLMHACLTFWIYRNVPSPNVSGAVVCTRDDVLAVRAESANLQLHILHQITRFKTGAQEGVTFHSFLTFTSEEGREAGTCKQGRHLINYGWTYRQPRHHFTKQLPQTHAV